MSGAGARTPAASSKASVIEAFFGPNALSTAKSSAHLNTQLILETLFCHLVSDTGGVHTYTSKRIRKHKIVAPSV